MRRCPHCQAPNPTAAQFCQSCGLALPELDRPAFWYRQDWWDAGRLRLALMALVAILVYRLSFGSWLTVGMVRQEWHFFAFHFGHGLLMGAGLAWMHGKRGRPLAWIYLAVGALAGVLTGFLEYWYTYGHVMQALAFKLVQWFHSIRVAGLVPYRSLQVLRLAGILTPLALAWLWLEKPRAGAVFALALGLILALTARSFVLGYPLNWPGLGTHLGLKYLHLYAFSALAALYVLAPSRRA